MPLVNRALTEFPGTFLLVFGGCRGTKSPAASAQTRVTIGNPCLCMTTPIKLIKKEDRESAEEIDNPKEVRSKSLIGGRCMNR